MTMKITFSNDDTSTSPHCAQVDTFYAGADGKPGRLNSSVILEPGQSMSTHLHNELILVAHEVPRK